MSELTMVLLGFGVVGLGRVVSELFSRDARTTRTLAERPRTSIANCRDGTVRVTGRVRRHGELLKSPVSGRACVAFHLVVEANHGRQGWRRVVELRDARPFVITDETGDALIDTTAGPFHLALNADEYGGTGLLDRIGKGKRQQALMSVGAFESPAENRRKRRYHEGIVREGETIAVGGRGVREVSAEGASVSFREPPQWLVLRGSSDEPLLISDSLDAIAPEVSRLPRR